jgi:hypothetical protein
MNNDAFRNSVFRDGRLDTAMRSIWGGQACCSALPHRRAVPHRVARTAQDARSAKPETAHEVRRDSSAAKRSDAPEKRIYGDA